MPFRWNYREHLSVGAYILKWFFLTAPVAALIGSACALFLWLLEGVTQIRFEFPWLLFGLPLAGAGIAFLYLRFGRTAEGGNNLLMEAIHGHENDDASVIVPGRMAPLILVATVVTHLFGGSAGREGTAVQMGGSIASVAGRWLRLNGTDMRTLMLVGIAAGFGGIFGTPLAGTIFAMEVLAVGRIRYDAIIPCLMAALISDWACTAWGIKHTHYAISSAAFNLTGEPFNWILIAKVALAAVAFGLVSMLFAEMTHSISHIFKRGIPRPFLRPVIGALLIIGLVYILGTRDYLGLGVSSSNPKAATILSSFLPGGVDDWSWWWKLLFTAITLGSGFKGGEVTPLFFIGAALGNVLGKWLGAPVDLFAGIGFVAVFAGATNTPLACTLMGIELFGSQYAIYFAIGCFISYLCSGHSGIYLSQRIGTPKLKSMQLPTGASLRTARELRPGWDVFLARWREKSLFTSVENKEKNASANIREEEVLPDKESRE